LTYLAGKRLDAALATLEPDKLGRPPTRTLLSKLILAPSEEEWAKIVRSLRQKPGIPRQKGQRKRQVAMDRKFEQKWMEDDEEALLARERDAWDDD
jgi:hypothetical protein